MDIKRQERIQKLMALDAIHEAYPKPPFTLNDWMDKQAESVLKNDCGNVVRKIMDVPVSALESHILGIVNDYRMKQPRVIETGL